MAPDLRSDQNGWVGPWGPPKYRDARLLRPRDVGSGFTEMWMWDPALGRWVCQSCTSPVFDESGLSPKEGADG